MHSKCNASESIKRQKRLSFQLKILPFSLQKRGNWKVYIGLDLTVTANSRTHILRWRTKKNSQGRSVFTTPMWCNKSQWSAESPLGQLHMRWNWSPSCMCMVFVIRRMHKAIYISKILLNSELSAHRQSLYLENGSDPKPDCLYGVWASVRPSQTLTLERNHGSFRINGDKMFCSGAGLVNRALRSDVLGRPLPGASTVHSTVSPENVAPAGGAIVTVNRCPVVWLEKLITPAVFAR